LFGDKEEGNQKNSRAVNIQVQKKTLERKRGGGGM